MNFKSLFKSQLVFKDDTKGFAIVELLVVIAVVGVLSSIVMIGINPAKRIAEAHDIHMKSDLATLRGSIEAYAVAHNGRYPSTAGAYWCENCTAYVAQGANNWIPELVSKGFIKYLPTSPLNGMPSLSSCTAANATYMYMSNGVDYRLFAHCMPTTDLNNGGDYKGSAYCTPRPPYTESSFVDSTVPATKLKPMVDPARPTYAYAIYSRGYMCL